MSNDTIDKIVEAHWNLCPSLCHKNYTCKDDIGRAPCSRDCEYMERFRSDLKNISDEETNK